MPTRIGLEVVQQMQQQIPAQQSMRALAPQPERGVFEMADAPDGETWLVARDGAGRWLACRLASRRTYDRHLRELRAILDTSDPVAERPPLSLIGP